MKSAYDRAMERFGDDEPVAKLSDEQKAALAAVDENFNAKKAEKEMFLDEQLKKAVETANYVEMEQIEEQKRRELAKIEKDREAEKDVIRKGAK